MNFTVYQRTTADHRVELIYVSQALGGPNGSWMTVYRSLSGGEHRIKSIPMMPTKDEAQAYLDAYAKKKKGWGIAQMYSREGHRPMTWEEASRR